MADGSKEMGAAGWPCLMWLSGEKSQRLDSLQEGAIGRSGGRTFLRKMMAFPGGLEADRGMARGRR